MSESTSVQEPWKKYKRYSDNVKLEARLIEVEGRKLIQVKESRTGDFVCPHCGQVISHGNAHKFPPTILDPKVFHERHRPLDKD